jgi:ATP-binding cassette subfamily C (CFTR/MRP) protein 1
MQPDQFNGEPERSQPTSPLGNGIYYDHREEDPPIAPNHVNQQHIRHDDLDVLIRFEHADISLDSGKRIIRDLNTSVLSGSVVAITGPVGIGKSLLLKAILKEASCTSGSINVTAYLSGIGYCSQHPWIPHGTIQSIICGTPVDGSKQTNDTWYESVINACDLAKDIQGFALGDATTVGSRGATLSGGQRQRIALARALYPRPSLLLLDNIFSSLDVRTKATISDSLFGHGGLLETLKSTVVMVIQDSEYVSV